MLQTNKKERAKNDFFFHMPSAAARSCLEDFFAHRTIQQNFL